MMTQKIRKLATQIGTAELRMERELARLYPIGTDVRCTLQHGQINPSHGQVIGHPGGRAAYVQIRLRSRTNDVRTVPVENVW